MATTRLRMPHSEAATKLQERIDKAEEIARPAPRTAEDVDLATTERREKRWRDYNIHMLRKMFTTDEFADEYRGSLIEIHPVKDRYFDANEDDIRDRLVRSITEQLNCLASIRDRLGLIDEDSGSEADATQPEDEASGAPAENVVSKEEWITAAEAVAILKPAFGTHEARITICKRAHRGIIRAHAQHFMMNGKTWGNCDIPKEFWWAEGHQRLRQNWTAGDFETSTNDQIPMEAFGVSFLRAEIEKMLPTRASAPPPPPDLPPPSDLDELRQWLSTKPASWSQVIAVRAVLRALPIVAGSLNGGLASRLFRAISIARYIAAFPRAKAAVGFAAAAANLADRAAFHMETSRPVHDALTLVAAVAVAAGESSEHGSIAAAESAIDLVSTITDQATEIDRDAKGLSDGTLTPERLAETRLWPEALSAPSWWAETWVKLDSELNDLGVPCWRIWYDDVVAASPRSRAWQEGFTDVPGPLPWENGAEAVNAEIIGRLVRISDADEQSVESHIPVQPQLEDGPQFQVASGKLDLVPGRETDQSFDHATQTALQRRLKRQIESLKAEAAKAANQHPSLRQTVDEYAALIDQPLPDLDVVDLWAVGNALMAQARSFEKQDQARTLTTPLEPAHLALLLEVGRLHAGFIVGFSKGVELMNRADRVQLTSDVIERISEPTSHILSAIAQARETFTDRARRLADVLNAGLVTGGWKTARVGYTS
jgi:hypothetical protein